MFRLAKYFLKMIWKPWIGRSFSCVQKELRQVEHVCSSCRAPKKSQINTVMDGGNPWRLDYVICLRVYLYVFYLFILRYLCYVYKNKTESKVESKNLSNTNNSYLVMCVAGVTQVYGFSAMWLYFFSYCTHRAYVPTQCGMDYLPVTI